MQLTFRTSPPANYISPSADEMRDAAKQVGLGSFSRDLVADLCNLAAGGLVEPPSSYRDAVRRKVEEALPAADSQGRWIIPVWKSGKKNTKYTKERGTAIAALTEQQVRYHTTVCDFLQAVDVARFPGATPLEQAMSLLKLLSTQQGGSGGGQGGEPLPIFQENARPEGVAETLHEAMDAVDSLSEEEQDMLDPEGKNHDVVSEQDGQRSGHGGLNRLAVAEDMMPGQNKRVMLDISRQLDQFTKLQVRKQKLVTPDPAGDEVRQRPMKHLGELSRVSPSAWALRQQAPTYFLYKAVTGQHPVRERVTRLEKKQVIFLLLDGSGSMNGQKHWKASGIVMNRLKAVISGDAVVYICVFDTQLTTVHSAATPEEARKLIKEFAAGNYTGGGTDIAASVKAAHKYIEDKIKAGELLYRPEVCVLTDDDTSCKGVKKSDIPGTRVHGFAMSVANPSLLELARSTGGVGIDNF